MNAWGMCLGPQARRQVLTACMLVALSGAVWVVMGWNLDPEDYGSPLRTWRHRMLVLHGVAAYVLLWIVGRLYALHQQGNWRAGRNRMSGLALSAALLLLAGSGLTLYYPPHEDWRYALSLFHQLAGLSLALLMPLHILLAKKGRKTRQHY